LQIKAMSFPPAIEPQAPAAAVSNKFITEQNPTGIKPFVLPCLRATA
jgi:hypothetical protein